MTINIYILKGDLNGENYSGAFLFLFGIYESRTQLQLELVVIDI